jgi:hypothetical protein
MPPTSCDVHPRCASTRHVQVTPRRLYQAAVLWRKTALAWLSALAHPPSFEYPRLAQLVGGHIGR